MDNDTLTIKAALDWAIDYLTRTGDENPRLSTEWLLSKACGLSRIDLYTNFSRPLFSEEHDTFYAFVVRRAQGEPLQYITGEVAFRFLTLRVRPGVFIPRPETEVLVSEALALLPKAQDTESMQKPDKRSTTKHKKELTQQQRTGVFVADLCTGSGCVACSIAYEHPQTFVYATDIAPKAVALAQENAEQLGLAARIEVLACDLGQGIPQEKLGQFDLVISNPPYIPRAIVKTLSCEVSTFEPVCALDGGDDGLDVVRRILPWCAKALKPNAGFALELYEDCLDKAADLARAFGFTEVRIAQDLTGRPRILTGRKPQRQT